MDNSSYLSPVTHDSEGSIEKDYAHDLPENLLNAGWRKFWSKRENREYYYNKVTGTSLWDLNELQLQESSYNNSLNKRKVNNDCDEISNQKRACYRSNTHIEPLLGPAFIPGSLYNFVSSKYVPMVKGRRHIKSVFLPPHPLIEFERSNLLNKLRSQFVNSCMTRENIQPPDGSFNRWLLQMKTIDYGYDPIFPSRCDKIIGSSMKRELLLSLPFPIVKPKYLNAAKTQLIRYSESVKGLVERRNASPPCRKIIKHNVDETLRWIRSEEYRSFDDYIEKLVSIKRICQPHIQDLVRESVEKICIKMYNLSQEYTLRLRTNHLKLLQQNGIPLPEILNDLNIEHVVQNPYNDLLDIDDNKLIPKSNEFNNKELTSCHPLGLACPCPLFTSPNTQMTVTIQEELNISDPKASLVLIEIPDLAKFHITKCHFEKLETLYLVNTRDDPEKIAFNNRLWCLLQRYYSYLGCENGSFGGVINQAALPVAVFEVLNRLFDVNFEMFASPLNCYFPQYCSAFHDTDRYFGSCGPALEFFPVTGSFEANPPFCEELLLGFVNYVEKLLQNSELPLSFIVFIPDWRDPPFEALTLLEVSPFNRHQMTLRAREHEYRIANFPPNSNNPSSSSRSQPEILKKSGHSTLVVFLQNSSGFQRWTPTTERLNELMAVYYTANLSNNIPSRRDFDEEYVNSVS